MFGTYWNMESMSHWTNTKLKSACDPQIDLPLPVLSPRMSVPQTPFYCFWEGMSDSRELRKRTRNMEDLFFLFFIFVSLVKFVNITWLMGLWCICLLRFGMSTCVWVNCLHKSAVFIVIPLVDLWNLCRAKINNNKKELHIVMITKAKTNKN